MCLLTNLKRMCCKGPKRSRQSKAYKTEKHYMNGKKRFNKEVDIVEVLKAVRMSRLYINAMTHQK